MIRIDATRWLTHQSDRNVYIAIQAAGGLGLFVLGMIIMTEDLRELAGNTIRPALMHFTSSPTSGAVSGAISTAILQSSSATTVTAVGFVGAGLMTFTSPLGIIFGANIGTTITGWLVACSDSSSSLVLFCCL